MAIVVQTAPLVISVWDMKDGDVVVSWHDKNVPIGAVVQRLS